MIEKKVTLIYPKPPDDFEFLLYPPLGLLYVIESFKNCGWEVSFINGQVLSTEDYNKRILSVESDFVGISIVITQIKEAERIAKIIKERDSSKIIILGGPGVEMVSLEESSLFDILVKGEAENFPIVLEKIKITKGEKMKIKCSPLENLDLLPDLSRDILPLENYLDLWKKNMGRKMTTLIASRGCPYNCAFCNKNVSGKKFRSRSPKSIVDEMELLASRYSLDEVIISDDFFSYNKERVIAICKEITKRGLDIAWSAQTRVDSIDLMLLKEMKKAGCVQLCFGVESGSNQILSWLKKDFTAIEVEKAFTACREIGINTGMCLIVGIPGEKKEDIEATKEIIKKCRPYELGVSYLVPFPGTVVYERTKQWIKRNDYENWTRRNIVYDFPYEIDPREAREDIFSVFFNLVEKGMDCSPFQLTLDY